MSQHNRLAVVEFKVFSPLMRVTMITHKTNTNLDWERPEGFSR